MNSAPTAAFNPARPGPVVSPTEGVLVDASCRHAALTRLLYRLDPKVDPRLIIGNIADTRVRETGGQFAFQDLEPALVRAFHDRGYLLRRNELRDDAQWSEARSVLAEGRAIVVWADTYHLAHYWVDRGRVHNFHSIVLEEFDQDTSTVRMIDAVGTTFFDDRVALADLEPAVLSNLGQAWFELRETDPIGAPEGAALRDELAARSAELGDGGPGGVVGGARLAAFIRDSLDGYLTEVRARYEGAAKPSGPSRAEAVMAVMWNYHHTLRWFAQYLEAQAERGIGPAAVEAAGQVSGAAQNWLIARNLLMRTSMSDPVQAERLAGQIRLRLDALETQLRTAVRAIDAPGGSR